MTRYRIVVQGEFGTVGTEGKKSQRGFYAACFVAAESELQAKAKAMDSMQNDPRVDKLKFDWNSTELVLSIEETTRLTNDDEFDESPQGFVVYDESARA